MRWSHTIAFVLVSGGILTLAALVTREQRQDAAQFLETIEKRFARADIDHEQLLMQLELAREQAEREGRGELARQIQSRRGRVLLELGSFEAARTDLAEAAAAGGAERELQLLRIELEKRAGDPRAGLALARPWLETHPQDAAAWRLAADLERLAAERTREHALALGSTELVSELVPRFSELLTGIAGRGPRDPRRVSLAHDLRELFGPGSEATAEELLVLADRASQGFEAALADYGRSLELETDGAALGQFTRLLSAAGRGEDAIDVTTAAWRFAGVRDDEQGVQFLLGELCARERWRFGSFVAGAWGERHRPGTPFLLDACRAAYGVVLGPEKDPGRLFSTAAMLNQVATSELGILPLFYMGEALFHQGGRESVEQARFFLARYAASEAPEPFPGARAQAWRDLAACCQTLGLAEDERTALEGAVELDPRHDGESWLRLAELQLASPHGGFRGPDLRWATGMSLLPLRSEELRPRWEEIGRHQLDALGFDPAAVREALAAGGTWEVSREASPFELHTLARLCLEARADYDAQAHVRELLELVPGFVPALDLACDLALQRARPRELVDAFLARLEQVGFDERSRTLLAGLPAGALTPADERRIARADPETSGRLAVARSLAARGEARRARALLATIPDAALRPDTARFAAGLELAAGAPDAAFARLLALPGPPAEIEIEALLDAGLRAGRSAELKEPFKAWLAAAAPARARWLALCDRLLLSGETGLARMLAVRLDQAGKGFRGGDVLVRLAAAALAQSETAAVERLLERAAAFDTRGEAELLALLALDPDASPAALRAAVLELGRTGWKGSALARAALALLSGETDAVKQAVLAARDEARPDPLWQLVAAALAGQRPAGEQGRFLEAAGTRGLAELLLALERPHLGAFARARLAQLTAAADGAWSRWWRARLCRAAGEREREEAELRALLAAVPSFVAAWDRLEELLSEPAREGESELDLRLAREAALGERSGSAAEREFDRSRRLEREGSAAEALAAARGAAAAAPGHGPIQRHLGRLCAAQGLLGEALAAYRAALALLPVQTGAASTAEYLELLARASRATPPVIGPEQHQGLLEQLARLRRDDPRVTLAQAQGDLSAQGANPGFGVARAYARLERFREAHPALSFEHLAPGSTEAWSRFLLELDPARAQVFLEEELAREPGNVDAWALLARCHAEQGRSTQALQEIVLVQRIAPGWETLAEYVRVRSGTDWSIDGIRALTGRIQRERGVAEDAPSVLALEARALLHLGLRAVPMILERTADADTSAADLGAAERLDLAWSRAIALLARGTPTDLAEARTRLDALEALYPENWRRPVLAALRGLARTPAAP